MAWVLHFDGLTEPVNPGGVSTYGFEVRRADAVVHSEHGLVSPPGPDSTNNVAEYMALIKGLEWLAGRHENLPVHVRGDSMLVVEQLLGRWRVKKDRLGELNARARRLLAEFPDANVGWVPREENEAANRLTELAYEEWTAKHPEWIARARSQPASARQLAEMRDLGLDPADGLDRREAARMIDVEKRRRRKAEREAAGGTESSPAD